MIAMYLSMAGSFLMFRTHYETNACTMIDAHNACQPDTHIVHSSLTAARHHFLMTMRPLHLLALRASILSLLILTSFTYAFNIPMPFSSHSLLARDSSLHAGLGGSKSGKYHVVAASSSSLLATDANSGNEKNGVSSPEEIFEKFTQFLIHHQRTMISEIEDADGSSNKFCRDCWGAFATSDDTTISTVKSGGITRVIQGGNVVEKGACSLTVLRDGILTADRAATIRGRQAQGQSNEGGDLAVQDGDNYSAAALSVVLHTRNPFVPVRIYLDIFCVCLPVLIACS